jgi:di/tricarboxylate transporter
MWTYEIIIVLVAILFILISLYKELIGPALTFVVAVIVLGITRILEPAEMISGFANEQIAVILMLLLLGDIIRRNSIIELIFDRLFRNAKSYRWFMAQMMFVIGTFSAFLNNTPLVAVMMPYVRTWSNKKDISPSKLLIPLSYAAILGGAVTLIGTSTNLIVNGLVIDQDITTEVTRLGLFHFSYVGIPMFILGFLYMVFIGSRLLPSKPDIVEAYAKNAMEYIIEAEIRRNSKLIGKTIEEAKLRNLQGLFLVEIVRNQYTITAVSPDTIIYEGDRLMFAGETKSITNLIETDTGLTLPQVGMLKKKKEAGIVEIVISHNSTLIAKTVKNANFRGSYDSAVVAIHRNGERIHGKIGDVRLKAGDALLLMAGDDIKDRSLNSHDFYFISKVKAIRRGEMWKSIVLLSGTATAIMVSALGFISLFLSLLIFITILFGLKITNPKDIPKRLDFNLGVIIAMALALGTAMMKTGTADLLANSIINLFQPFGVIGLLFGIYIITALLASYITYSAAIAIVFPISLTMAVNQGLDPMPFILIVAHAAAANFMTPIGYQTNLMVYGPGRYSFKDFFKVGFPLTVLYMVVTVFILYYVFLY